MGKTGSKPKPTAFGQAERLLKYSNTGKGMLSLTAFLFPSFFSLHCRSGLLYSKGTGENEQVPA
ncbi:hypothetical protein D5274_13245 [bacterium 1XD42-94]|nr:hypothetical protein [bacterium 1XD42-76]NBK06084.1 hypothetical protein [bacterium 1XD42-94]